MAVLEKIRVKLGIFITVLIAIALLSFIVDPSTLEVTLRSLSSKYDVGKINGKSIGYEEYQKKIEYYTDIYSLTSGSQSLSEEAILQVQESAWQDLESEYLIVPTIEKSGINVGVEEMFDLSQGKELSPIIAQDGTFKDASGNFNREQLRNFIKAIPTDQTGNLAKYWQFLETNMKRQQYYNKYTSLIANSNLVNPVELRRGIEENNNTANVQFVLAPFGFDQDTTLTVTNKEIQDFYNKHIEEFKQNASRDIEYVVYEVVPSQEDITLAQQNINKEYDEFKTTDNFKTFLAKNSDLPYQEYYFKKGELESLYPEVDEYAFSKSNEAMPIIQKDNLFLTARIADTKVMSDSAFVNHILVNDAKLADSLLNVINKGGDFSALASQYSLDTNPNVATPGEIGWMTQSMMIKGLESVLTAPINKPFIVSTSYGTHIVNVTEKSAPLEKVKLAIFTKEAISSKETFQDFYSLANSLSSRSEGDIEKFNQIVKDENIAVLPANQIAQGSKKISNYEHMGEVVRWIYDAKKGEVSPILTVDNKYFFVVAVTAVREEGYAPIQDVSTTINYTLLAEKRADKKLEEVKAAIAGMTDLDAIATALNTTVSSKNDVSFGAINTQTFDPILIGSIAAAEEGKIVGPIKGNVGVYVLKVDGRNTGAFYTENDAKLRASQLQNYQMNNLPAIFNTLGNIKDNRAKFF